jgi:uncharacterized membrane protein
VRRAAALTIGACVAVWVLARWVVYDYFQLGDTRVYEHAARMIDAGAVPYRDFDVEYPPLATGVFWIVGNAPGGYQLAFSMAMLACLVATALAALVAARRLGLSAARQAAAVAVVALAPVILGTLLQTRYDLVLSALLGWALVAALHDRFRWAWLLLTLAVAAKLVPVLLVPVLFLWHSRRRRPASARGGVAALAAGFALTIVPFVVLAPHATWRLFSYHLQRPLQLESIGSSIVQAAHLPFQRVNSYGSENIAGRVPDLLAGLSTLALLICLVSIAIVVMRALRGAAAPQTLVAGFAATLTAIVVFGKVLSPQYLIWLLPAVLLVEGRRGWLAVAVTAVAMGATQLVFPLWYADLVERSAPLPLWLLVGRNALLLLLLVLVWPRRPASERPADGADVGHVITPQEPA